MQEEISCLARSAEEDVLPSSPPGRRKKTTLTKKLLALWRGDSPGRFRQGAQAAKHATSDWMG